MYPKKKKFTGPFDVSSCCSAKELKTKILNTTKEYGIDLSKCKG